MVIVTASYTIIPNDYTPKGLLCLSESDQVQPWTHSSSIYIYKANHNDGAIERMRDSLSNLLVHYYPLAGRLRWIGGGRLELDCNAKGVKLIVAESTKTLTEFGDFTPNETIKDLIPMVDYNQHIEEIPLMLVQLTKFHGHDGEEGLAMGVAMSHALLDGLAAIHFINTWAKMARGDTLDEDEMSPFLDRTILKSPHPQLPPRFDHLEFKPMPLILGSQDSMQEQKKETSVALLKLTPNLVEKLKKKTNDQLKKEGSSRPYSRYEAIAAHIWRSASKARQGNNNNNNNDHQETLVRISVDIRRKIIPQLPSNYFGNAVMPIVTLKCYTREIMSNPLSYAAQKIREAIEMFTNEYIQSQLNFIRSQEELDSIRASYHVQLDEHKNIGPFYGNPNLSIVSWTSLQVYGADFGWGKPVYLGPGVVSTDGTAYIIQGPEGDGSITIAIRLQTACMTLFSKFFYQDI